MCSAGAGAAGAAGVAFCTGGMTCGGCGAGCAAGAGGCTAWAAGSAGSAVLRFGIEIVRVSSAAAGVWPLRARLSTYQAGVCHDYTGVRPAVLYAGPEGLALRLHRISGEEAGGAAMPAEEPEAQAPDPQPDEAALAFRYSHRAATVTPS